MIEKSLVAIALATAIGMSSWVHAQGAPLPAGNPQTVQHHSDMVARVKQALHADPGLSDKHIDVSMQNGKVLLKGFVNSSQDLQKAVRAADKVAGAKNVLNQLTIKPEADPSVTDS